MSVFHSETSKFEILGILKNKNLKIHFLGVGGVGMYSLFMLSSRLGYSVSGSDRALSVLCNKLIVGGYDIYIGHSADNAVGKELIVYTLAANEDNPEIVYAQENGIPFISRAEYLGALMENYSERISVSGSHGKSTTTAMISRIFEEAGKAPTVILGANLPDLDSPLRIGENKYLIFEGCEYKDSFLRFSPSATVFTNLELDHVDYFRDIGEIKKSFLKAMNIANLSVVNYDDENLRELIGLCKSRVVTYGESQNSDYRVDISQWKNGYYSVKIRHGCRVMSEIQLTVPGRFNAMNAAAAAVLALEYSIPSEIISDALSGFSGIERRIQEIGSYRTNRVFYDYAHHPTEIREVIKGIREMSGKEVAVIFKPHTYSRTAGLMEDFVKALSLADKVFLCEISGIRERAIDGVSSSALAFKIGEKAVKVNDESILDAISEVENSSIVIMGAANLDTVRRLILKKK